MKRWWWIGAAMLIMAFASGAAAQQNVLVLYGSPDRDWVAAVANKFEKDTGIKVQWIRASSNEMYAKIEAEKANPQGDVWFGGTGDPHFAAAEAGLTEPYCPSNFGELREWMRDPIGNCRAIGLYAGPLGWAVNEGVLKKMGKPMPQTWDDLTKPEYKGLIAISNPTTAGTAYTALVSILLLKGEDKGWEYLAKLHKNVAQYTRSGGDPSLLAGRGEVAIGVSFANDVVERGRKGYPIRFVAPKDGTGYEIGGIALITGGPNRANGMRLIDWALEPENQRLGPQNGEVSIPSHSKSAVDPDVPRFESVNAINYDFGKYGTPEVRDGLIKKWTEQVFPLPK